MGVKMASYFATVLEDKVSVAKAVPQNTKKAMKFGLSWLLEVKKSPSFWICNKFMKMQVAEVFHFTSTDLVNSKQLSPQVWCIALHNTVYLNAL